MTKEEAERYLKAHESAFGTVLQEGRRGDLEMIKTKRIYEQPAKEDGFRILVDRLWPRGISKDRAKIDLWLREIGPSDDLRKWFSHDPRKWQGFKRKYETELRAKGDFVNKVKQAENEHGTVTLLYSTKDEEHNQAIALSIFLKRE